MGVTTLQVNCNSERMIDLAKLKKLRKASSIKGQPGYLSDDSFAAKLLFEKIDEEMKKNKL